MPANNFYQGVILVKENNHSYLMATPWKAIFGYVFCYKKNWKNTEPLIDVSRFLKPREAQTLEVRSEEFFTSRLEKLAKYLK